jgi:murein L,D-transpeptidase YafK
VTGSCNIGRMCRAWALIAVIACSSLQAGTTDRQPAYLLDIPSSVGLVLVAETETSTLHVYENVSGQLIRRSETYMSIGQNGVGKTMPWDRRTPLGVYFITERLDTSGLHEKYGPAAFPLDYPNVWDRNNRRGGDGIWIHGVTAGSGRRPALDTDGCIALPNEDLLALEPLLVPGTTPVVIARRIEWASTDQIGAEHRRLQQALARWAESFAAGDIYAYLSLYAEDFSYRGMSGDEWAAFRTQSFLRAPAEKMVMDEIFLLADPDEPGLYLSRFRQSITYSDRTVVTLKRLYWQEQGDGSLAIVAEDNG